MEFIECESKSKVEESKCNRFLPEVHVAACCVQMTMSTTHASLPHVHVSSSSHTHMSHMCSFNVQIGGGEGTDEMILDRPVSPAFSCNYSLFYFVLGVGEG